MHVITFFLAIPALAIIDTEVSHKFASEILGAGLMGTLSYTSVMVKFLV